VRPVIQLVPGQPQLDHPPVRGHCVAVGRQRLDLAGGGDEDRGRLDQQLVYQGVTGLVRLGQRQVELLLPEQDVGLGIVERPIVPGDEGEVVVGRVGGVVDAHQVDLGPAGGGDPVPLPVDHRRGDAPPVGEVAVDVDSPGRFVPHRDGGGAGGRQELGAVPDHSHMMGGGRRWPEQRAARCLVGGHEGVHVRRARDGGEGGPLGDVAGHAHGERLGRPGVRRGGSVRSRRRPLAAAALRPLRVVRRGRRPATARPPTAGRQECHGQTNPSPDRREHYG
jgi:hypothetical protein